MKLIIIISLLFLLSCKSTENESSQIKQKYTSEELLERVKRNAEEARLRNIEDRNSLNAWGIMVHQKIQLNMISSQDLIGNSVKVKIFLNDEGYVISTELLSTTGNKELETRAISAINSSQPFILSSLSAEDKKMAKEMVINVKPN